VYIALTLGAAHVAQSDDICVLGVQLSSDLSLDKHVNVVSAIQSQLQWSDILCELWTIISVSYWMRRTAVWCSVRPVSDSCVICCVEVENWVPEQYCVIGKLSSRSKSRMADGHDVGEVAKRRKVDHSTPVNNVLHALWNSLFSYLVPLYVATSQMWCWSGGRGMLTEMSLWCSIVYHYIGAPCFVV